MSEFKRQEVNLYLPHLQPKADPLSPKWVGSGLAAIVVVFAVITALNLWQNEALQQEVVELELKAASLTTQAEDLKGKLPKSRSQQLDSQIEQVRQQIQRRQRIKGLVDAQNLGNSAGFSGQMEGLARRVPEALSLSSFRLSQGGGHVDMIGMVEQAETVPLYIEKLQREASFASANFGVMQITRKEGVHEFSLGETPEEGPMDAVVTQ